MGDKWDESHAQEELPSPPLSLVWKRYPEKEPDLSKNFQPSAANLPVGTRIPSAERFVKTWTNIFLPVLEKVATFTNVAGTKRAGYYWKEVGFSEMLKFSAILMRMSIVRRNRMDSYFAKKGGDLVVRSFGMSLSQFQAIYRNVQLCDEAECASSGVSNPANVEKYDSLYSIRLIWNLTFERFQLARTPGEVASVDESLVAFDVS